MTNSVRAGGPPLDDLIKRSLIGSAFGLIGLFIVLVPGGTFRGTESEGLGIRGLVAFAVFAIPMALWIARLYGTKNRVEAHFDNGTLQLTKWWGGTESLTPVAAVGNPHELAVNDGKGHVMHFRGNTWDLDAVRKMLDERGLHVKAGFAPRSRYERLVDLHPAMGILVTLGILVGFIVFVFIVVNVAARL